jgi:hypothetical protein
MNRISKKLLFFLLTFILISIGLSTNAQSFTYGTGALGALNSTGNFSLSGAVGGTVYNYTSFTLNAGHTLTITGAGPVIIRVTGTATINGTINAAGGNGGSTSDNTGGAAGTVSGGNGGGQNGGGWQSWL